MVVAIILLVLAGLAVAVQEIQVLVQVLVELLTPEVAAVVVDGVQVLAAQAVQALSLFPTLEPKEAQAAQSHHQVATLFTHLHLAVLTQVN